MMHGQPNIKFGTAQQAEQIHRYKNIKTKVYKTNAAIWYNKTCRLKHLTPNYISIKINGHHQQCQKTNRAATQYRLNQDMKFLYIIKQKLNEQLYKAHLECAATWKNIRNLIQSVTDKNHNNTWKVTTPILTRN
jgi:hypothetical protein